MGDGLRHQRDDEVVGVGVLVVGSRPEVERVMGEEMQQEHRRRLAVRVLGRVRDQWVVVQEFGQAAGVVQGLAERHLAP